MANAAALGEQLYESKAEQPALLESQKVLEKKLAEAEEQLKHGGEKMKQSGSEIGDEKFQLSLAQEKIKELMEKMEIYESKNP